MRDETYVPHHEVLATVSEHPHARSLTDALAEERERRAVAERALGERVKELTTLTHVARLTNRVTDGAELAAGTAEALRTGMQWPEHVIAYVELDADSASAGGDPRELVERLEADVTVNGTSRGTVAVGHREARGFLLEFEQQLIDGVATSLAAWLHRQDTRSDLERRQLRLQGLFDNVLDAIFILADDGTVIDANPAACALTGYSRDELLGRTAEDLTPAHRIDELRHARHRLGAVGELGGEFGLRRRDGSSVPVEYRSVARVAPGVHVSIVRDISARRSAEQALRDSEARFRRIAENAQDVIFRLRLGEDARFEYVSPAVVRLTGFTPDELYRRPDAVAELVYPADQERLRHALGQRKELPSPLTLRWQRRDGSPVWVEQRHTYVYDAAGEPAAVEGIVRDISDRKGAEERLRAALAREREATERLQRVDEMKNTFLSSVSHELRTPLTSVVGFSSLLDRAHDRLPPERVRELLGRLVRNAERLAVLLEELLDVDRLTRGVLPVDTRPADLGALVLGTLRRLDPGGHPVTTEVEPVVVPIDAAKVERIVENLVVNAVRHTDPGTPIWVSCGPDANGALLTVADAGPGIHGDQRELLFEPFQLGESAAAKVGGTGLGLTIVARFAELHGGRAWVDDRDGGGAAFHVWLPGPSGGAVTTTS